MPTVRQSTRLSIRWLPDPPSEPTDTLVFTIGPYFLDLRIRTADGGLDWAIAGVREVLSTEPLRCRYRHIIDSRRRQQQQGSKRGNAEEKEEEEEDIPDEGVFIRLPSGDDLERGTMACPERGGAVSAYEEVWRRVRPRAGGAVAWVVRSVGGKEGEGEGEMWMGRVGGTFLGVREGGGGRREEWDAGRGRWVVRYAVGGVEVPGFAAAGEGAEMSGEGGWRVGERVRVFGREWEVLAFERLAEEEEEEEEGGEREDVNVSV